MSSFAAKNFQRQSEAGECGLACISMIASHYGLNVSLSMLRRAFSVTVRGATVKTLIDIADALGLSARPMRSDLRSVLKLELPALIHWDLNHFVVLTGVKGWSQRRRYEIADPGSGLRTLSEAEFSKHFTGIVVELVPNARFARGGRKEKFEITQLWSRVTGLVPSLGKGFTLSLLIQAIALTTPLFLQLAMDKVVPSHDLDLALVLAIAFGALLTLNCTATWLRSNLASNISHTINFQTAANLFHHTVFLPISWFQKRHLGDIVSRFSSLQPIADLFSRGLISAAVDGLLGLLTLVLLLIYSLKLACITVCAAVVYSLVKLAMYQSSKLNNGSILSAAARENSLFIETIRGIETIKLFGQEKNRQRLWQLRKTEVVDGSQKVARLSAGFEVVSIAVLGMEQILFMYFSCSLVMSGEMTFGMIFAYLAYKSHFLGATTRFVEQLTNYKLLDVHLDRLAELAFATPEKDDAVNVDANQPNEISIDSVSFRYGDDSPYILRNSSLQIERGKTTAIVGLSGGGKTTLLKIASGLLCPESGSVKIDGVNIDQFGRRRYRSLLGVVSQDDVLFAGSIAENISFFDVEIDHDWLVECCCAAAIHDDVMRMPLRYETSVGDMGSTLSGGQKQRVLLARALYRKPSLLIMDEGTAHLDVETEEKVSKSIRSLGMSRLIVAHRPETINSADKVYVLHNAHLTERTMPGRAAD